jgi:hypothetical protein
MKTSRVLSVVINLLDEELINLNSPSFLQNLEYKFQNLYFVIQAVTQKKQNDEFTNTDVQEWP